MKITVASPAFFIILVFILYSAKGSRALDKRQQNTAFVSPLNSPHSIAHAIPYSHFLRSLLFHFHLSLTYLSIYKMFYMIYCIKREILFLSILCEHLFCFVNNMRTVQFILPKYRPQDKKKLYYLCKTLQYAMKYHFPTESYM